MTYLFGLLVLAGLGTAIVAWAKRGQRRVKDLRAALELAYLDADSPLDPAEKASLLAKSGLLAERALAGTGLLTRLRGLTARSDWNLSSGELVAVSVGAAVLGALLGVATGSPVLVVILAGVGLGLPLGLLALSVGRRTRKFDGQLPDILDLVAASLESGAGVPQALELVVAEADDPAAAEFARVLTATRLGTPLTDALTELAERIGSRDLDWTVQAIVVQQRTGGRLAEVLRIVATVMRAREEVRRELRALTAEGKLSAYVLGALPVVMAGFMALARPDYLRPLYTTGAGVVMLVGAVVAAAIAFAAMLKIVRIEV